MNDVCLYEGRREVCLLNTTCLSCELFLESCIPIPNSNGYAPTSELDCFLCNGCPESNCYFQNEINL